MANDIRTPPNPDEIEVSLFGPGYGEAVALHIGGGKWLLIDSCTSPGFDLPLHLRYLDLLGVNPATSVVHVVVSHWHDDHIRGISSVVEECASAKVSISNALRQDEFLALASLYDGRPVPGGSGVDEFLAVLRHLEGTGSTPVSATVDRILFQDTLTLQHEKVQATVFAISPSDAATLRSKAAFALMFPAPGTPPPRVSTISPNESCVAILVEVGSDVLLLGADLEASANVNGGWSAVLTCVTVQGRIASVFKVPHHGGQSAHDGRVWASLLRSQPYAILTPFRKGRSSLPDRADIKRIVNLTANAFVTGLPGERRWRSDENVVEDMVKAATTRIVERVPAVGQVRLRKAVIAAEWSVELFGGAQALP